MAISPCFSFLRRKMVRLCSFSCVRAVLLLAFLLIGLSIVDIYKKVHFSSPNLTLNVFPPAIEPDIGSKEFFLLAIVTSRPGSKATRETIRQTWGSLQGTRASGTWKMIFNLGRTFNLELDLQLEREARIYRDLLIGNYKDTYDNLIIKVFTAFTWATRFKCKYILKADDDVYVHVPRLIKWLQTSPGLPSQIYAGALAIDTGIERVPWKSYFLSYRTYNGTRFHTYCRGPYYVMSHNILNKLWHRTKMFEPFRIEDAYVGLLIVTMGVTPVQLPGCSWHDSNSFYKLQQKDVCFFKTGICVGDRLSENAIQYAHEKFSSAEEGVTLTEKCLDNLLIRNSPRISGVFGTGQRFSEGQSLSILKQK